MFNAFILAILIAILPASAEDMRWVDSLSEYPQHILINKSFLIRYQLQEGVLVVEDNPELCTWVESTIVEPRHRQQHSAPKDSCLLYALTQIAINDTDLGTWADQRVDQVIRDYTVSNLPPYIPIFDFGLDQSMCHERMFVYRKLRSSWQVDSLIEARDGRYGVRYPQHDLDGDCFIGYTQDRCPEEKGDPLAEGCPDRDKDTIPDFEDPEPDTWVQVVRPEERSGRDKVVRVRRRKPYYLNFGLGYWGSVGNHGGGLEGRSSGQETSIDGYIPEPVFHPYRGAQHGFRAMTSWSYQYLLLRGYYVWGLDRSLPLNKEVCMSGGVSFGADLGNNQKFRLWLSTEFNIRGVAKYPEYGGEIRNLYKGPAVVPSLELMLFDRERLTGHLELGYAWSVGGTYSEGRTEAHWAFLSLSLEGWLVTRNPTPRVLRR